MNDEALKDHLDNDKNLQELFPCINCGINADPADGFGNCTCGNEKLRDTIDQYTQSKLKAFAGEVEASIGIHLSIDKSHACRFNDGEQNCDCFINGRNDLRDDFREALKAIKEKYQL